MKFDYAKILLPGRSAFFGSTLLKPIIPIRVTAGGEALRYDALVDSGADFSIFHTEIGRLLGLDIESGDPLTFGGVQKANTAAAYLHIVTIGIGGWDYQTTVGFSDDIADDSYGILGQRGFFDLFVVRFDYQKEVIEISPKA